MDEAAQKGTSHTSPQNTGKLIMLTDSNGVGCAMRPRPAKDSDVRSKDP